MAVDTATDEELVPLARAGDRSALDALLQRYVAFAHQKAKTYFLAGADRDDIVQEGLIGLYKAIRDFDPGREASFKSFAELCVSRQVLTAIKNASRRKHQALNAYVSIVGDGELGDVGARVPDPQDVVVATDEAERIRAFLAHILSDLEAEVLAMYVAGKSYQDIASELDRGAKSIDNALQRIKRKLEAFLRADAEIAQVGPARRT